MRRPPVIIEKIRHDFDDSIEYRIQMDFGLGASTSRVVLTRHEMETARDSPARFADMIKNAAVAAFLHCFEPELERLYRQTGDFDNSGALREIERYEAMERQLRAAQAAPPLNNLGMLAGLQNQNDLRSWEQQRRQQYANQQGLDALRQQMYNTYLGGAWGETEKPKQNTVDKKAMELLASKIGWRKMRQLKKKGYFEEQGKHGKFRFHLDKQGGVTLIERKKYGSTEREVEWSLCVQSMAADLPKGDVILSRWMEWKADEDKFLDTANFRSIKTRDEATSGRI